MKAAADELLREKSGGSINDISFNITSDGTSIRARATCESVRQIGVVRPASQK